MSDDEMISGPLETVFWLAALEYPGGLHRCIVCGHSTAARHPRHGGVHPRCCPAALRIFGDGLEEAPVVVPRSPTRSRGAYSRRGMVA